QPESIGEKTEGLTAKTANTGEELDAIEPTSPNLVQSQTSPISSQETGLLQSKSIGEATENLTPEAEGELEAIEPTSPDLVQSKLSSVSSQETVSLQPESIGEKTEGLTAKTANTGEELDAIEPTSPNLVPSQTSPISSQETGLLQSKSIGEATENLTPQTEGKQEAIAPTSPNLIQSQISPRLSQQTGLLQSKSIGEQTESLTAQTEGEEEGIAPTSPNLIQSPTSPILLQETEPAQSESIGEDTESLTAKTAKTEGEEKAIAPTSPNLIQTKTEPVFSQKTLSLQPEAIGENTEKIPAQTDGEVDANQSTLPNLTQAKSEPISSQETRSPQPELIADNTENLAAQTDRKVDAIAPDSPNLIQAKTAQEFFQKTVSLQPEASGEKTEDLTDKNEVDAIAPNSPNLIQSQPSPESSQEITSPQLETLRENREDVITSPDARSDISSDTITSSQTNLVQARSESPSLNLLKPLGNSKSIAQTTDLLLSDFVTDAADKQATISSETSLSSSSSPPNISKLPEEDLANISLKTDTESPNNSAKVEKIPNSWSSISELLGESPNNATANLDELKPLGFSQQLNNTNKSILPKLDNKYINNNEQQNNIGFDMPTSWSSISELLGESFTTTADSIQTKNEVSPASLSEPESSPSYTLASPNLSDNSTPTSEATSQQITAGTPAKDTSIEDEQLEELAQKVYTLMRQWLEVEQERQGNQLLGYPIWPSNITSIHGTSAKVRSTPKRSTPGQQTAGDPGEVSPVDDKLQKLTGEIYYLLRQRLEIDRERRGGYYTNRLS
ncbi:hypothetical protein Q5689_35340, partial [Microcoleus sp. ARI1-A2]